MAAPQPSQVNARGDRRARRAPSSRPPGRLVEQRVELGRQRLAGRPAARAACRRRPRRSPPGPARRAQPIAGTPAGHRLDVGDAERLVDARQHEDAAARARSRSAARGRAAPRNSTRPRTPSSPASRSSAGALGAVADDDPAQVGVALAQQPRARAGRRRGACARRGWPTVTRCGSRGALSAALGRQVGAQVHDADVPRAQRARPLGHARRVGEHEPRAAERPAHGPLAAAPSAATASRVAAVDRDHERDAAAARAAPRRRPGAA